MHSGTQAADAAGFLFALPLLSWLYAMRDRGYATGPACSPRHVLARPDYLVACNTAALADADAHAVLCGAVRYVAVCSTFDRLMGPARGAAMVVLLVVLGVGEQSWRAPGCAMLLAALCCCRLRQLESREPLSNPLTS